MTKFKEILGSSRFQQMLIVSILQALVVFNVITGDQSVQLVNIVSYLFGASVLIGTVDKASEAKAGVTSVTLPKNVTAVTTSKVTGTTRKKE